MQYKLTKGPASNYEIELTIEKELESKAKETVLKEFQKDMTIQGFRKGFVPLNMVEQNVKKEYLDMGIFEEMVNKGIQKVIEENNAIKFIGQPYDLNRGEGKVTFKLDVYPEIVVVNNKWEKNKIAPMNVTVTNDEVKQAIDNLRRQYAEYKDTDSIELDTVSKIKLEFVNKDGQHIDKGSLFLGKEDFEEFQYFQKEFIGKKKNEQFTIKYTDKLPATLLYNKEVKPESIKIEIVDIKQMILPEMNAENIEKYFGSSEVKDEKELMKKVEEIISTQKEESELVKSVEDFLKQAQSSFSIVVPKTIIEEEFKARLKSLQERMGGEQGLKKYAETLGEEKTKKLIDDIQNTSKDSLQKFFLFRKLTELLDINDIDREKPMDAEKKIYAALSEGKKPAKKAKEDKEETVETKKVAKPKAKTVAKKDEPKKAVKAKKKD